MLSSSVAVLHKNLDFMTFNHKSITEKYTKYHLKSVKVRTSPEQFQCNLMGNPYNFMFL